MVTRGDADVFLDYSIQCPPLIILLFFASLNWQKLQIKMEKNASPFWRMLQAASGSF